jgi:hypothetical protein
MKWSELKPGDVIMRTKPCDYGNGHSDHSYIGDRILVVGVVEGLLFFKHPLFPDSDSNLDQRWDDGNWAPYPQDIVKEHGRMTTDKEFNNFVNGL